VPHIDMSRLVFRIRVEEHWGVRLGPTLGYRGRRWPRALWML
jgi:hypothetical protein